MKKLGKKVNVTNETLQAYACECTCNSCSCSCSSYCGGNPSGYDIASRDSGNYNTSRTGTNSATSTYKYG